MRRSTACAWALKGGWAARVWPCCCAGSIRGQRGAAGAGLVALGCAAAALSAP